MLWDPNLLKFNEVTGARKVKFSAQVVMNKKSDTVQKLFSLRVTWENSTPTQIIARKLILELQVNTDKATVADMTLPGI